MGFQSVRFGSVLFLPKCTSPDSSMQELDGILAACPASYLPSAVQTHRRPHSELIAAVPSHGELGCRPPLSSSIN